MNNRKNTKFIKELDNNNNIEFLDTNTNNKNYISLNNFSIFNKIDKLEEEFAVESRYSNNNLEKRIFNQIKLFKLNSKSDMYKEAYRNREIKTKNFSRENKDILFRINDFINDEAAHLFKYNNCLNLKQLILKNMDIMKLKINRNNDNVISNGILNNLDIENILKSEDRYLMTNEHIINNCVSLNYKNGTLKKNNLNYTQEELENWKIEDKRKIIDEECIESEEYKNCRNSKNREDYKKLLFKDNIKLRKNISAVLKKQEDLHKFLECNLCPIISKNFEKEKKRLNKIELFSANPNKRSIFNKSQNSIVDKNAINKQENHNYREFVDLEVRNIQDENRIIPRKFKTANDQNKRNTNLINVEKTKQDLINNKPCNQEKGNLIAKINRINRHESQDKNVFFLTNLNKINLNNQPKEESEIKNKRYIFTPDVNQMSINLANKEFNFFQRFPARTILKIKSDENIIKKNKSWNIKNSDVYYKNKKKIQVFECVKDYKIPLQNKNLSHNLEFNGIGTKYELMNQDTERGIISKDHVNSFFKGKNERTHSKRNSEYSDINVKEDRENSIIDIIISKTNSNKKIYNNQINKQEYINLLVDTKLNFNVDSNNNDAKKDISDNKHLINKKTDDLSPKKSEIKEYNFDPIEKELNFSRNSSEIKDDLVKENEIEIKGSSWNLFNYKSKSNFDKSEAFNLKENLKSNAYYKEKSNEIRGTHKYSNSKHNVFNSSVPRIVANKSASNFFSKTKFFSYAKDGKLKNIQDNMSKENLKFTESLNVKKVKFVFDKSTNKGKTPDLFQNKVFNKSSVVVIKNKK